jgi:hypothetical protein
VCVCVCMFWRQVLTCCFFGVLLCSRLHVPMNMAHSQLGVGVLRKFRPYDTHAQAHTGALPNTARTHLLFECVQYTYKLLHACGVSPSRSGGLSAHKVPVWCALTYIAVVGGCAHAVWWVTLWLKVLCGLHNR